VTVPVVLSPDHATILSLAQSTGGMVNMSILARELGWDKKRSMLALNVLLREGMTWIDEQVRAFPLSSVASAVTHSSICAG
jgi:hypothetical protein